MKIAALSVVAVLVCGCHAVGPDYKKPDGPPLPSAFAHGQNRAAVDAAWWKNFNDPVLTRLIETTRSANFDLAAAEARLREARALADVADGGNWGADVKDSYLRAVWEVDLFGKVRRGREAALANLNAVENQRDAVLVSLSAEVATAYFELCGIKHSLRVAEAQAARSGRMAELERTSFRLGKVDQSAVTRAQLQGSQDRAALAPLRQQADAALARIAVLTGQAPGLLILEPADRLPVIPNEVAVGLPADLLRNRPDVQAAERALAASVAEVGGSTANLYPQLALGGSLSYSIGSPSGFLWAAGPTINWAGLNMSRVRSEISAAQARADAALAHYQQTVLEADEEATNALSAWKNERDRRAELRIAAALTRTASVQTRKRMEAGLLILPDVLTAEQAQAKAEMELTESETKLATNLVAVYRALGGGWTKKP